MILQEMHEKTWVVIRGGLGEIKLLEFDKPISSFVNLLPNLMLVYNI